MKLLKPMSLNDPLFVLVHSNKSLLKHPVLTSYDKSNSSKWIRAGLTTASSLFEKSFDYNIETLQVKSEEDSFLDDLGYINLNGPREYLKFKKIDYWESEFFDNCFEQYNITPSALVYLYFVYCTKLKIRFALTLKKYVMRETMLKLTDARNAFDVIMDIEKNIAYVPKDMDSIDQVQKELNYNGMPILPDTV